MSTRSKGHNRKLVVTIDTVGCYSSTRRIGAGRSLCEERAESFDGIQGIWSRGIVRRGNVLIVKLVPWEALFNIRAGFDRGAWRWEAS